MLDLFATALTDSDIPEDDRKHIEGFRDSVVTEVGGIRSGNGYSWRARSLDLYVKALKNVAELTQKNEVRPSGS